MTSASTAPRSSLRPTLIPPPRSTRHATHPPMTMRSATVPLRGSAAKRVEAYDLVAVTRLKLDFLESLVSEGVANVARQALDRLHHGLDSLEERCADSR